MSPLLFVAATAVEWQAALGQNNAPTALPEHHVLPLGEHGPHALLITGVGPVNAATAMGAALHTLTPGCTVINVGLAGSFDLGTAPLGSVWRVRREISPEYGLAHDQGVDAQGLGFAQWQSPAGAVWDRLDLPTAKDYPSLADLTLPYAMADSLSVAGVTNSKERAQRLARSYADNLPLLENMEGFALALACARHALPLVEIRVVSNLVGSRAQEHRAFAQALKGLKPLVDSILLASGPGASR